MNFERLHAIENHQVYNPFLAKSRIQQEKSDDFQPWSKSDSSSSLTRGSKIGKKSSLSNLSVGSSDSYDNTLNEAINVIDQARFQRNRSAVRTGRKLLLDDTLHIRADTKDTQSSDNNFSRFSNNLALFDSLPKQSLPSRKKKSRSNEKRVAEISQIMKELKVCQGNISKYTGSSEESSAKTSETSAMDRRVANMKSMEELFKTCDDLLETFVKRSEDSFASRCSKNYRSTPNLKTMRRSSRSSFAVACTGSLARRRRSSVRFDLTQNEVFDI
ncbi:predicted protein [Chaetoceros tenuissimus]|uniref:Uncharacterized protein n=1 Tax=Chaetoceros tenuissimus TaxID=426638 RepID=A0AAD3CI02_9STRA|nr:predicted protein [Chaetoceros tenuissimus]